MGHWAAPASRRSFITRIKAVSIVYRKQREALAVTKEWGAEKFRSSAFRKAKGGRGYTGLMGESAAHVVDEYLFELLADFEQALAAMGQPQFKRFSEGLAPFVVAESQRWTVYRVWWSERSGIVSGQRFHCRRRSGAESDNGTYNIWKARSFHTGSARS